MIQNILKNRYEVKKPLGSGGFGNTYQAIDLDLPGQPNCVVKHLTMPIAEDRFNKEAEVLYRLGKHNQIPQLFAHFQENGEFYLVQEFIDGHELTKEIRPGEPQKYEQVVLKLLHDILEVLAFVHQNNVIHRDIKPQNLMRRQKDGKIVLIDFGAVKEICTLGQTNPTVAIGTPGYMPPEQLDSQPHLSSDIYAVGIIGLQALTGLEAWKFRQHMLNGELCCDNFSACANISPDLAKIIDQMVRCDYTKRYPDATIALKNVRQLLNNEPNSSQEKTIKVAPQKKVITPPPKISLLTNIIKILKQIFGTEPENPPPPYPIPEPPIPKLSGQQPEGPLSLDSPFYIKRPIDENYKIILQPGALIRIKAPPRMGKTSLLIRILDHAQTHGYQTAYLNLNWRSADEEILTNLDKFLQWFCISITDELKLPNEVINYWHNKSSHGSKRKCTKYFEECLLSKMTSPVVLGLDEIDRVFPHQKVAFDFLGMLRNWYDNKNQENWQQLRLVIVHSKEVDEIYQHPEQYNQSPFNVGLPIELPELNQLQVQELIRRHELSGTDSQVKQLMGVLGGHPYLLQQALYKSTLEGSNLQEILKKAPTREGIYNEYLNNLRLKLQRDANLVAAFKQVVTAPHPVRIEGTLASKLRSMGLVKFQGNDVIPVCNLYRQYFRNNLR